MAKRRGPQKGPPFKAITMRIRLPNDQKLDIMSDLYDIPQVDVVNDLIDRWFSHLVNEGKVQDVA